MGGLTGTGGAVSRVRPGQPLFFMFSTAYGFYSGVHIEEDEASAAEV